MRTFDYQRLVIGYHGCDAAVRDRVILHGGRLNSSQNEYDWLGHGIYFWEHGPERALEWAKQQRTRGKIQKPAVLGAVLHLGQCFDLLDAAYTDVLADSYREFCRTVTAEGKSLPKNEPRDGGDPDNLLRKLDCAAINWTIEQLEVRAGTKFHSVRGVFQEGDRVYPESEIRRRSHIQIAVRDAACVLGYFLPSSLTK
jgi:hypothetical protein